MTLTFHPDPRIGSWTADSRTQLFVPAGFEAYARQRFVPDPTAPGQQECDVEVPDDHPRDIDQARHALHTLARFTGTPQECYFGVWDGWPGLAVPADGVRFDLPDRRYAIFRGAVTDVDEWASRVGAFAPPDLVWPADRSWFFSSDVDPHWAGIGATRAAIDTLVADPEIDVVPAHPTEAQPFYY